MSQTLLDTYLPRYQFSERHSALVAAPPAAVLDAVAGFDFTRDPLTALLMALRRVPGRVLARSMPENFSMRTFVPLGRDGDREIAAGLIGRFWRLDGGLVAIADANAFAAYAEPGVPKLVMNFSAQVRDAGALLVTETRVFCPDLASLVCFTPYWYAIRLGSGLIRRRMLSGIRARL